MKSVLFWIYIWQLKEYRFDRFWAEYGVRKKLFSFWLFSGGRKIYQPKWTAKAMAMVITAWATASLMALLLQKSRIGNLEGLISGLISLYLLLPIVVAFIIVIFKIPTFFFKQLICHLATQKIAKVSHLTVIGITGSYGKSSTKEFLTQILEKKFRVIKTPENVNTDIGIAKFILATANFTYLSKEAAKIFRGPSSGTSVNLSENKDREAVFIVEMGAYKRGEIKKICDIVKPKIGIITGINEQHMALFGSLENIMKAKYELIESLPENGLAVFNGENNYCLEMARWGSKRKIIYNKRSLFLFLNYQEKGLSLPPHYLLNLAGAVEVANYLGMNEEIKEALKDIRITSKMIKKIKGRASTLIIDDTYSANPDGVFAGLDYLAQQPQKIKIVVMPCLIELGKAAEKVHQQIGKKIKEVCELAIITTPDYFYAIEGEASNKLVLISFPSKIIEFLKDKMGPDTAILLEGRLPEQIVEFVKSP